MPSSRKPGPVGSEKLPESPDDGTLARLTSPRAGPLGSSADASAGRMEPPVAAVKAASARNVASRVDVHELRVGSAGSDVERLQRQLNARLAPSPPMDVDGIFGPVTQRALMQYQDSLSLAADGIVGRTTWYHLLKGDNATIAQTSDFASGPVRAGVPTVSTHRLAGGTAAPAPNASGVWEWPMQDKFAEALRRTAPKLPGSMAREFMALLSPASLGIAAGTLVLWAGSHAFGVGEAVDVLLLLGGLAFLGMAAFDVAQDLGDFLVLAATAGSEKDLDDAAASLARAIAVMGVAAFVALLAKVARARAGAKGSRASSAEKAAARTAQTETAGRQAAAVEEVGKPPARPPIESPLPKGLPPEPAISRQKQDGHIRQTPQHQNRVKQGKPTSTFNGDAAEADRLTQEAWARGTPVPGRPGVRDHDFGRPIGTGPRGGNQSIVRVHQDADGRIHGHPSGPEKP